MINLASLKNLTFYDVEHTFYNMIIHPLSFLVNISFFPALFLGYVGFEDSTLLGLLIKNQRDAAVNLGTGPTALHGTPTPARGEIGLNVQNIVHFHGFLLKHKRGDTARYSMAVQ